MIQFEADLTVQHQLQCRVRHIKLLHSCSAESTDVQDNVAFVMLDETLRLETHLVIHRPFVQGEIYTK